jgi:mRNA-degrading endonuclease HigB of HigAB toxin-antitoxin module
MPRMSRRIRVGFYVPVLLSAEWKTPSDIKEKYRNASFFANNRVVFNIHGNKYRLIVAVMYPLDIKEYYRVHD